MTAPRGVDDDRLPVPADALGILEILDASVTCDARPPGFEGSLGVGLVAEGRIRWWIARFEKGSVSTGYAPDPAAGARCDCLFLLVPTGVMTRGQLPSTCFEASGVVGDREILRRTIARYFAQGPNLLEVRLRPAPGDPLSRRPARGTRW